ncbi:MAG TPA: hypothetical protein ENI95_12245 [Chloroflexi bacterium]|nr:hypothetical protein [Chloroflexota bacterium]
MITLSDVIYDVIFPVFDVLAVILRLLGVFGAGAVAGAVVFHAVAHKVRTRFYVPLVFLGAVVLFGVTAYGRWSSPGALGALGIGLFAGYRFLRGREGEAGEEDEGSGEE